MIIFGLGNPGEEYLLSRHNMGFMVVDALAINLGLRFRLSGEVFLAKGSYADKELWLVKPLSYMNLSGRVVQEVLNKRKDEFLVVTDDVDLELGRLRLKKQGGTSGHKGLASIQEHLGTDEFARLRIGTGSRPEGAELSDYVLERFSPSELTKIPHIIDEACDAVLLVVSQGIEIAMNEVNIA